MPDITKLPKWAQEEFRLLTMRLQEAKERLQIYVGKRPGRIVIDWYDDKPLRLPDRSSITFILDDKERRYIDIRLMEDGRLRIHSTPHSLLVMPQAANAVDIVIEE